MQTLMPCAQDCGANTSWGPGKQPGSVKCKAGKKIQEAQLPQPLLSIRPQLPPNTAGSWLLLRKSLWTAFPSFDKKVPLQLAIIKHNPSLHKDIAPSYCHLHRRKAALSINAIIHIRPRSVSAGLMDRSLRRCRLSLGLLPICLQTVHFDALYICVHNLRSSATLVFPPHSSTRAADKNSQHITQCTKI